MSRRFCIRFRDIHRDEISTTRRLESPDFTGRSRCGSCYRPKEIYVPNLAGIFADRRLDIVALPIQTKTLCKLLSRVLYTDFRLIGQTPISLSLSLSPYPSAELPSLFTDHSTRPISTRSFPLSVCTVSAEFIGSDRIGSRGITASPLAIPTSCECQGDENHPAFCDASLRLEFFIPSKRHPVAGTVEYHSLLRSDRHSKRSNDRRFL